MFNYTVHILPY